jgi:membrane-associated protease RseP (regulator of RpoE activity)
MYPMNWLPILVFFIGLYLLIVGYIKNNRLWEDHITFYGPILAVKSARVGFFDRFIPYTRFLRIYGSAGVAMVVIISVLISLLIVLSVQFTLILRPEPTGIYEPQNILLLPGINEFVPFTFAVWFAFVVTLIIHEFGHGILCRVEHIRVKSIGVLFAVIPIGAFVEPDEEDVECTRGIAKARMFGAGITNNLVFGFASFAVMLLLIGMIVPTNVPVIQGVYQGYPADIAGIPQNSIILQINGIDVHTREDVAAVLGQTRPGDAVTLVIEHEGVIESHTLGLAEWPEELGVQDSGFVGIYYFDAAAGKEILQSLGSPLGLLRMITVPFDSSLEGQYLRVIAFEGPSSAYYTVPFSQFWGLVHVLFWCAWININVGIFNAIPMVPLDGGYIMQEGVTRFFEGRNRPELAKYVVGAVSWIMLVMIVSLIALPYLLNI